MSDNQVKLSAFLDGELSEAETLEMEAALNSDPALQAELEALVSADAFAVEEFENIANEPVPIALAAAIQNAPESEVANSPRPSARPARWMMAAAALLALTIGGTAGYVIGTAQNQSTVVAGGWLSDIADYHAVYASQARHLVEVPASESDHIKKWLTASVGDDVPIPDLSSYGLEFQGARLLVAAGKPVSQLMYKDETGQIVAICQIKSSTPKQGFSKQTINAFDLVSWGGENSNFVIVADEGRADLSDIAQSASSQI